jgi:hypothetical protein
VKKTKREIGKSVEYIEVRSKSRKSDAGAKKTRGKAMKYI